MRRLSVLLACLIVGMVSMGMAAAAPDTDAVILYYSFDAIENGKVIDESPTGADGVIVGKIDPVEGVRGKAGKFTKNSYIDVSHFPQANIPTDAITISAWVNVPAGEIHEIFNTRASDATWVFHPEIRSEGTYRWLVRTAGSHTVFDMYVGKVEWDTWVHFAAVYSATEGYGAVYINGEEIGRQEVKGVPMMQDWGMGARVGLTINDARPFSGLMDDLILWSKALTADEIRYVMENGIGK